MLSTQHLNWPEARARGKHLKPRWVGPCKITALSKNKLSVTLEFPSKEWQIHNVVPVTRVKPYHTDMQPRIRDNILEDPEVVDSEDYFEIESIVGRRYAGRNDTLLQYRVKYVGYDDSHNKWLPFEDIKDSCEELIEKYDEQHPLASIQYGFSTENSKCWLSTFKGYSTLRRSEASAELLDDLEDDHIYQLSLLRQKRYAAFRQSDGAKLAFTHVLNRVAIERARSS